LKIENRVRFVSEIITGKLVVHNRKKIELLAELKQRKYDPIFKFAKSDSEEDRDDDNTSSFDHGYDYLLSMPIWSLTLEKVTRSSHF
jgi:DNA topoisomerase-2